MCSSQVIKKKKKKKKKKVRTTAENFFYLFAFNNSVIVWQSWGGTDATRGVVYFAGARNERRSFEQGEKTVGWKGEEKSHREEPR